MSKNICIHCGKPIKGWGVDGCPIVKKGNEMSALFGGPFEGWTHYKCNPNNSKHETN